MNGLKRIAIIISRLYSLSFIVLLLLCVVLTTGCTEQYSRVPFCWTTDYRISPEQRFLKVNASEDEVAGALIEWVKDCNDGMLDKTEEYLYTIELHPEAGQLYEQAHTIAEKQWHNYNRNTYKKPDLEEWKVMLDATSSQVIRVMSNRRGFHIKAMLAGRKEETRKGVNIEDVSIPVTSDGHTVYIRRDDLSKEEISEKTGPENILIFSVIDFYIFRKNDSVFVYASGAPYNINESQIADNTATIDYSVWPSVNAGLEASLIKKAYDHLLKLYPSAYVDKDIISVTTNKPTAQLSSAWSDIWSGRVSQIQPFIEQGANVNIISRDNITPLYLAVQQGHTEMTKMLLDNGANVNAQSSDKVTSLYIAAQKGHVEIVKLLLKRGADTELGYKGKFTPLYVAAANGNDEIVRLLLNYNADVNSTDNNGWTALHISSSKGHLDVVKLLLKRNANPQLKTNNGDTPLSLARQNGHRDIAELLQNYD